MDIARYIRRYGKFYDSRKPDCLVIASIPGLDRVPADLTSFDFTDPAEHRRFWNQQIDACRKLCEIRTGICDDWIPGYTLRYGFGAFGGPFIDTPIRFTSDTSYLEPAVHDWKEFGRLRMRKSRFWAEMFLEAAAYISRRIGEEMLFNAFPVPSPLDLAWLVRGNDIYTDMYDFPAMLHDLLQECVFALGDYSEKIISHTHSPWSGVMAFNRWISSGILLLEDAANLCSPANYAAFGFPYSQELINRMAGGYLHTHSHGSKLFPVFLQLKGLSVLQISEDPGTIHPMMALNKMVSINKNIILDIESTLPEVIGHIGQLREGKYIFLVKCLDIYEANETVKIIRDTVQA